jgi:putative ABC transport system permease protein
VTKFALKGLAGRKLRAALTALAIVLGVAMISGAYVLSDTIDRAFDKIFTDTYANTDAVVTAKSLDISSQGDSAATPSIPASLLATVRSTKGVDVAAGAVLEDSAAKLLTKEGKAIDTQGAPSFGFGIDTSPEVNRFNPLNLVEGRWPRGPDEIVIDRGTAKDEGYATGEQIGLASLKPVRKFRIVGLAQYGDVESLGSVTFAVLTIPVAQQLFERQGKYDVISVAAKKGVTSDALVRELNKVLPPSAEAKSGITQSEEDKDDVSEFTSFIRYFLLAFGGIALFVGAFVIFNTLSITVAQRTREFATVRTIGASRRQVLGSVVLEALVIGFVASVVGLFLGLALAQGIQWLFRKLNLDLPTTDTVFATRTIVVSLVVGTLITLLAGLVPAIRATRVPPIAAVREGATLPRGRFARFTPLIALVLTALAVLLLLRSLFTDDLGVGDRLLSMAGGVLLLFAGIAMLSSRIVRPLVALVGWPAKNIGGAAGKLAQENSRRNPSRTAATAAALMIGLALVTFVAVLAEGMRESNRDAIESQVKADYVVTSQDGFTPFVAGAGDALAKSPAVEGATSVRSDLANVAGSDKYVTGIDPNSITNFYSFDWKQGSDFILGLLGRNGAIVDDDFADNKNLDIGSRFPLVAPNGKRLQLEVKGIYKPPPFYPLLGQVSIPIGTYDATFERPRNAFSFANVSGQPSDQTKEAVEQAVSGYPDAKVLTREQWIDDQEEDLNQFLSLLYVLLALSVIISLFGMVNTLVLSTFERTRELGMLRAVGMTRRQVRRMVRHESVITALIGAALGIPLGIFLAVLVTEALSQYDLQLHVPVGYLIVFAVIAVLAGIAAAVLPARRAARLNVLQALQYE